MSSSNSGSASSLSAQPQNWYSFAAGHAGISYGFSFAMKNQVRAEIYIDRGEAETNKSIFDRLHAEKDAIEAEFGEKLTWERLDDKQASRIAIYREGSIQDTSEALEKT
jgi:hypothetical protein